MVFSSFPLYLDPPNNWNQQQVQLPGGGGGGGGANEAPHLPPSLGLVPPRADVGMAGSMRPRSMAGRARLAKLEQAALKCPRCDSTNTKFCYFNNYSLSQPRHFCKTCRRYWTHGGALRNVPVGGGCRRSNKRTKPPDAAAAGGGSSSNAGGQSGGASSSAAVVLQQQQPPHRLPDRGAPGLSFAAGMETLDQPLGLENLRFGSPMILSGLEPPPPPPHLHPQSSLAPTPSFYSSFIVGDGGDLDGRFGGQLESDSKASSSGLLMQQLASVKMEDNARSRLPQYVWGGGSGSGGWATTGFSSFN